MNYEQLAVGKQIVYTSYTSAGADIQEFGFVSSWRKNGTVFCRFWSKYDSTGLRTLANSEACNIHDLQVYSTVPQEFVTATIGMLRANPTKYGWHEGEQK